MVALVSRCDGEGNAARAPWMSKAREYLLPQLVLPSSRGLPAAQIHSLHASIMIAQHPNDLLFKLASPHHSSPSDELNYQWHDFREARQTEQRLTELHFLQPLAVEPCRPAHGAGANLVLLQSVDSVNHFVALTKFC